MTIFSDAYLPYPYGPVPSPGTPSPKFVDLLNNQTVGGDKTFSGRTSIARPATGTAEEHMRFTVSDDAAGYGSLANYTATNGSFVMCERGVSNLATDFAHAWVAQANVDTGSLPAGVFQAVNSSIAALTTRPAFAWYNGANLRMQMAASGAMTYTVGAQAGVAETLATWGVSDTGSAGINFLNGTTGDGAFLPRVLLRPTSGFSAWIDGYGAADTPGLVQLQLKGSVLGASVSNSIPIGFYNSSRLDATLESNGSFALRRVGQGLCIAEGSNAKQGAATLTAGTVTVANTSVTANSRIHATGQDGGVTGAVNVSARTPGVSFTLTSSNPADSGVVAYTIFEPS